MAFVGQSVKAKRVRYTPQSSIPANPLEGDVYYSNGTASAEGLYVYSNGSWVPVGSAGGQINYIDGNADAESSITGYSTYDDGASAIPVDGTGGTAANVTFSRNTSSPLRGIADFELAKAAADAQGEGASYDFTIDSADKNSVLRISFDYTVSTDYADDDLGVFIYDVTNGKLVRFAGEEIKASSLTAKYTADFQATDSTSYRLCFHVKTTNASAYSLNFDNVVLGPREVAKGPVVYEEDFNLVIDATTTAPTIGAGTQKYTYTRVGREALINIYIDQSTSGTAGNGTYELDISDIGTIDASIVDPGTTSNEIPNVGRGRFSSGGSIFNSYIRYDKATGRLLVSHDQVAAASGGTWSSGFGGFNNATIEFSAQIRVPIQGWSSNATISTDLGNRDVYAEGKGNNGASITSLVTDINFTEVSDSSSSFNGTVFTVPETGRYMVFGNLFFTASVSGAAYLYKNGVQEKLVGFAGTAISQPFAGWVDCVKGDTLTMRLSANATLNNVTSLHHIAVQKVQSPQTLLAGDTIAFRANSTAGQLLANSGSGSAIGFENVNYDTVGAFDTSTGTYVIPETGTYSFYTTIGFGNAAFAIASVTIDKNSTIELIQGFESNGFTRVNVAGQFQCVKGDVIRVTAAQLSGSSRNLETTANFVSFGGHKI